MATIAPPTTVGITVNGIDLQVPAGELIVESVKRLGLEIPIFCYHPRMKPVGMCRMCLVEVGYKQQDGSVRMMPKPQAGCTLPASEGMVIVTDSAKLHKDRKGVLEFLLINHPLDCPICDRGGECPLQNNTLFYGPSTSRFVEMKRHLPKAYPLSNYVTLDLERCIQCGRCVRFTEEISGEAELAFRFRGASMQPSTFELRNFNSKFSGNVIEICPVGALTSSKYRFRARPWDLETKPSICTKCSVGCNIWFDFRANKPVRVNGRTNEAINEEWTCDKGKFGHDFYASTERLTVPLIRQGDSLVQAEWGDALEAASAPFIWGGANVAGLASDELSNESLYLFQKLFRGVFRSNNIDHRFEEYTIPADNRIEQSLKLSSIQDTIQGIEARKAILVFGTDLSDDAPILHLRIRKAVTNHGAKLVVASPRPTLADAFANVVLRYRHHSGGHLAMGLAHVAVFQMGIEVRQGMRDALADATPDQTEARTGVPAADVVAAAQLLFNDQPAVVTSRTIQNLPFPVHTTRILAQIAYLSRGTFSQFAKGTNAQGAEDLGVLPDLLPGMRMIAANERGRNTESIAEGCIDGSIKALWLAGVDPIAQARNSVLWREALEQVEFLVVQGMAESEAMQYASVVLPMAGPVEADGSYTNLERTVQTIDRILVPPGEAKAAWKAYADLLLRHQGGTPFFNAADIRAEIEGRTPVRELVTA